ncbi:MAG: hypothetical protein JOS17DRAFT_756444 [Linnemannia elongata]|nr:MAG: hypothetical protein JOS17DRAFT_756444 [Linnemannia elongata]
MRRVPVAALRRHSHHLKILSLNDEAYFKFKLSQFKCTNLINLDIYVGEDCRKKQRPRSRGGGEGKPSAPRARVALLDGKNFLRSNPMLKTLRWQGASVPAVVLDPEDIIGLHHLEDLWLEGWDCSDGRLVQVLRIVSGKLKKLTLGDLYSVRPEDFPAPLQRDDGQSDKDPGTGDAQEGLRLDNVEFLRWHCDKPGVDYLPHLVKCCPNLRTFDVYVDHEAWDSVRLADSFRSNCLNLDALIISPAVQPHQAEALIRRCSSSGIRNLEIGFSSTEERVVSAILQHAATLEDLCVDESYFNMNDYVYPQLLIDFLCLPLLVGCTSLKRFSLKMGLIHGINEWVLWALKQQIWGCRGLQVLELQYGFGLWSDRCTEAYEQEMADLLSTMGWMRHRDLHKQERLFNLDILQAAFNLVQHQGLE